MRLTDKWIAEARASRAVMLSVVFYTNFIDYVLLTSVVPIIPDYLVEKDTKTLEEQLVGGNFSSVIGNSTGPLNQWNSVSPRDNVTRATLMQRALHLPIQAISENSRVGWLLSSKALVQLIGNVVVGYLSSRVSYSSLLMFGSFIFLVSSSLFAVAESYVPLLLARSVQGIGSAATSIGGMSMLAERYMSDDDRSRAMGTAMGGLALGILVGYPFGGILYAVSGKSTPFVGISLMCVLNIGIQIIFLEKSVSKVDHIKLSTVGRLFTDPYIIICAAAIMVTSMSLAVLESTVPIWAMDHLSIHPWQLGLIFIPDSVGYLLGTNCFPVLAKQYGRWLFTMVSLSIMAIGLIVIPFCRKLILLLVPHFLLGLGVGVTDAAIMPLLALLVDSRHVTTYGSVYAIVQLSVCLAYSLGPGIAGQIVDKIGFKWSMWIMALVNCICLPPCYFLRSPTVTQDKQALVDETDTSSDTLSSAEETVFAVRDVPTYSSIFADKDVPTYRSFDTVTN